MLRPLVTQNEASDALEDAQRRHNKLKHLLAEAAARLSPRLPYEQQLSAVAQLAVPTIGDWAALDVIEESDDGRTELRRVASTTTNHRHEGLLWELEAHAPRWGVAGPESDTIASGRPLFARDVDADWLQRHRYDADTCEILQRLNVQSMMVVPLRADDRAIGVLTIGTSSRRMAEEEDLELAGLVAERGAATIEAALLYRSSQRSAAARDALLGIVSHDLIGALGTISMFARSLKDAHHTDPAHADQLCQSILGSATMMHRLLGDLVDVSAIESRRLSVTPSAEPLPAIIASVREAFAERANAEHVTLEIECGDSLPDVWVDRTRIVQVLTNLVDNGIKYTPAGGRVTVSAERRGRDVLVCVRDTGAGVSPDDLPHIFERFWRAPAVKRTRGFGLGMAIVKGIVTAHGGRVWMESTLGKGSAVYFTLGRADAERGRETAREQSYQAC